MKARVVVTLKKSVLDPQGLAVGRALGSLGFNEVKEVRLGKIIELDLDAKDAAEDSLRQALRMRHHPEDVSARVGDPGDVRQRPVRVAARDAADTRLIDVPERDLLLALEPA